MMDNKMVADQIVVIFITGMLAESRATTSKLIQSFLFDCNFILYGWYQYSGQVPWSMLRQCKLVRVPQSNLTLLLYLPNDIMMRKSTDEIPRTLCEWMNDCLHLSLYAEIYL